MEVKEYLDALGPGPCSLIFFLLSDMSVSDFQYCFIVPVTLKVPSVLGLFFFFSSGVMKTTVYLTFQCRDLIGISTLTHLKKKSWSPCEVHSSVPCFVSTRHLPHSSLLQKHWSLPCLCLLCI